MFDGDRHIIEPLDALTKYLDKEGKKYAPKIVIDEHGGTRILIEGRSMTNAEAVEHCLKMRDEDMDITGVDVGLRIPAARHIAGRSRVGYLDAWNRGSSGYVG